VRFRAIVATLLVAGLAGFIAAPTAMAEKKIPTRIEVLGDQRVELIGWFVYGLLHSKNKKCVRNRSVLLGGSIDDLSSRGGAWASFVDATDGLLATTFAVKRKKLRNGSVCKATSIYYEATPVRAGV
jgi:hypothetical protein